MPNNDNSNIPRNPSSKNGGVIDLKKIAQEKKIRISKELKSKEIKIPVKTEIEDKTVFWWSASEETKIQRSLLWYLIIGIIIVALLIFSVAQKNWLFLVFIILAIAAYATSTINKDSKKIYRINQNGITVDEKLFSFKELRSFSFAEKNGEKILAIETGKTAEKYLIIPIKKDWEKISEFLQKHLPKKEYQESFVDTLKDYLGF